MASTATATDATDEFTKHGCKYAEALAAQRIFKKQSASKTYRLPGLVGVRKIKPADSSDTRKDTDRLYDITYDRLVTKDLQSFTRQPLEAYNTSLVALASLHEVGVLHLNLEERKFGVYVDARAGTREWVLFGFSAAATFDIGNPSVLKVMPDFHARAASGFAGIIKDMPSLLPYFRQDWRFVDWAFRERTLATNPRSFLTQDEKKFSQTRDETHDQDFDMLIDFMEKSITSRSLSVAQVPPLPKFATEKIVKLVQKVQDRERIARSSTSAGGGEGEE